MKKMIAVLMIISMLLVLWASGCSSKSDYEVYMEASDRTEAVARGKSEMIMTIKLQFNKEGLTEDVSDGLEMFEDMAFELRHEYDKDKEESLSKIFVKAKDTGIDVKLYTKQDLAYVITPLIPKIVVIKGDEFIHQDWAAGDIENMPTLSEESIEAIEKVWKALYKDDNVSALEKIVLDTPEGSVKATRFDVNITDEQLKPAIKKTMEIALNDSDFMKSIEDMMHSAIEKHADDNDAKDNNDDDIEFSAEDFSAEQALKSSMDAIENATIKTFSQTAFIDRDNYIIEERFNMDVLYHFTEKGTPKAFSMEMTIKNWDLNREQQIYFPEATSDNSITLDQLKDEYQVELNMFEGETE